MQNDEMNQNQQSYFTEHSYDIQNDQFDQQVIPQVYQIDQDYTFVNQIFTYLHGLYSFFGQRQFSGDHEVQSLILQGFAEFCSNVMILQDQNYRPSKLTQLINETDLKTAEIQAKTDELQIKSANAERSELQRRQILAEIDQLHAQKGVKAAEIDRQNAQLQENKAEIDQQNAQKGVNAADIGRQNAQINRQFEQMQVTKAAIERLNAQRQNIQETIERQNAQRRENEAVIGQQQRQLNEVAIDQQNAHMLQNEAVIGQPQRQLNVAAIYQPNAQMLQNEAVIGQRQRQLNVAAIDQQDAQMQSNDDSVIADLYGQIQQVIELGIVDDNAHMQQNVAVIVKRDALVQNIAVIIAVLNDQIQQRIFHANNDRHEHLQEIIVTLFAYLSKQENAVIQTRNFDLAEHMEQFSVTVRAYLIDQLSINQTKLLVEEPSKSKQLGYLEFQLKVTDSFVNERVEVDLLYEGRFCRQHSCNQMFFELQQRYVPDQPIEELKENNQQIRQQNGQQLPGRPQLTLYEMEIITYLKNLWIEQELRYYQEYLDNRVAFFILSPREQREREALIQEITQWLKNMNTQQKRRLRGRGGDPDELHHLADQRLKLHPNVINSFRSYCDELSRLRFRYADDIFQRSGDFINLFSQFNQEEFLCIDQLQSDYVHKYCQK